MVIAAFFPCARKASVFYAHFPATAIAAIEAAGCPRPGTSHKPAFCRGLLEALSNRINNTPKQKKLGRGTQLGPLVMVARSPAPRELYGITIGVVTLEGCK